MCGKKGFDVKKLLKAFREKFSEVVYLNISRLNLLSRQDGTFIKNSGINVEDFDGVFLKTTLKLAPFVEPLIDELKARNIFLHISPGAYYLNANEPLQFISLSKRVKVPKFFVFSQPKRIRGFFNALKYPIIFQSFVGLKKAQSIIVESHRSLTSIIKSIRAETTAVVLREFIEGNVLECAVLGEKVFAIKRKLKKIELQSLKKGSMAKISKSEKETAIAAVNCCGLKLGTVKLCNGSVIGVSPEIELFAFSKKFKKSLYAEIAEFFSKKILEKSVVL